MSSENENEVSNEMKWRRMIKEEIQSGLQDFRTKQQNQSIVESLSSQPSKPQVKCIGCGRNVDLDMYPDHRFSEGIKKRDDQIVALQKEVEILKNPPKKEEPTKNIKDACPKCRGHSLKFDEERSSLLAKKFKCTGTDCDYEETRYRTDGDGNEQED